MKISVLTLFPERYEALKSSIPGRALEREKFALEMINIRDYSTDKHKKTDDAPFGGGAGMVMTPGPLHAAIGAVDPEHAARRVYVTPKGKTLTQEKVEELSKLDRLLLINGSYEGIDQRVIELDVDEEISIGDYVLSSGDFASLVIIDALSRYLPGVLGSEQSTDEESFSGGLLEYPHYTRPFEFEGLKVPEVLRGGNHAEIAAWRLERAEELTRERRPDLWEKYRAKKDK